MVMTECFVCGNVRTENGNLTQYSQWHKVDGDFVMSDFSTFVSNQNDTSFIQHGRLLIKSNRALHAAGNWSTFCLIQEDSTLRIVTKESLLSNAPINSAPAVPGRWRDVDATETCIYAISDESDLYSLLHQGKISEESVSWVPQPFGSLKVKQVVCGSDHVIALSLIGHVYSAGIGSRGQLGHGDLEELKTLQRIEALETVTVIQIAAGNWHSLGLSDSGDVYAWGWNSFGQLGVPAPADTIHLMEELHDDSVHSVNKSSTVSPATVHALPVVVEFPGESEDEFEEIESIACGARHSVCWSKSSNILFTFGWNEYGQLGIPAEKVRWSHHPCRVQLPRDDGVMQLLCGQWCTALNCSSNR